MREEGGLEKQDKPKLDKPGKKMKWEKKNLNGGVEVGETGGTKRRREEWQLWE